ASLGELAQESWKFHQVLTRLAWGIASESDQTSRNVRGVADLAHLAIAHEVDANLDLATYNLGNRLGNDLLVTVGRSQLLALAREQHIRHSLAARQAADVCGQDTAGARTHGLRRAPKPWAAAGSRSSRCRKVSPEAPRRVQRRADAARTVPPATPSCRIPRPNPDMD